MPASDTKERILDSAEELFAEHGYDATSLRAVTAAAEVNLAAVNYHFGSKQGLYRAVFERRVDPLNRERLRMMDVAESEAGPEGVIPLRRILEAFFGPPLRMSARGDDGWSRFLQIVGRMNSTSGEHVHALRQVFHQIEERFFPAIAAALPHLRPADLIWRMHFLIGSMCTLFADPKRITIVSDGLCDSEDPEESVAQLVAFAEGALQGPIAEAEVDVAAEEEVR